VSIRPQIRLQVRLPVRLQISLFLLLTLSGCVGIPFDYPRTESYSSPADTATFLGQAAETFRQRHGDLTGVVSLPHGLDALGVRMRFMERAERTIDAQYFILKNDRAGALFAGKLVLAADRGVKVRLLIDDVFSYGIDEQLTLMNTHPNIEVRLFNPLSRQSFKYWSYLLDFSRANRRMHNKSFTVDNSFSIVGGRNIGEEYFELKQDVLFDDYEVLVMGPVVSDISDSFDNYWNSALAVPIEAFEVDVDPAGLDRWRDLMALQTADSASIYSQSLDSKVLARLRDGSLQPAAVEAAVVGDPAEKLEAKVGDPELAVMARDFGDRFRLAQQEVLIVTPYFIPSKTGSQLIQELVGRGVRVVIVTNSLASTNHVPVHAHYAKYRKQLLRAGAELWEIRAKNPGETTQWGYRPELVTLHSKATAIDRSTVFVGSINFDPRSLRVNTEMGLFLESRELGHVFTANLFLDLRRVAYRVELDERGNLRWIYEHGAKREVVTREPETGWGRRMAARIYRLLPIEGQL
jgi:putative cardiolipin synthase